MVRLTDPLCDPLEVHPDVVFLDSTVRVRAPALPSTVDQTDQQVSDLVWWNPLLADEGTPGGEGERMGERSP